jgi:hypothetical protein
VLCAANGDSALAANDYDKAIYLYSRCDGNYCPLTDAHCSDTQVIELDPLSYLGYNLKHAALYGEAIETFHTMLSILDNAPDVQTRSKFLITHSYTCLTLSPELRQQYLRSSEVERAIRRVIGARLNNAPLRVLDTNTGLLCNRETQIDTFQTSTQYKALVSSTITHVDLHVEHIEEVVKRYLQYAMLSHRWEGKEPLLRDIQ